MDFLQQLQAICDRNQHEYEELARLTSQTVAQVEADTTTPDPQEENNDD